MSDIKEFISNGFVLKKKLFSNEEIKKLNQYIAIRKVIQVTTARGMAFLTNLLSPVFKFLSKF